jgi:hypothetical protein
MFTGIQRCARVAVIAVVLAGTGISAPAAGSDQHVAPLVQAGTRGSAVVEALATAGDRVLESHPVARTAQGFVSRGSGGTVRLPADAGGNLVIAGPRRRVSIGMPGGAGATGESTDAGVVYEDVLPDTNVVARVAESGDTQILAVLASAASPTELRFPINGTGNESLRLNVDGSASLVRSVKVKGARAPVEVMQGEFAQPWAVDAAGVSVPTIYEARGNVLVQHVFTDASTAFPVIADPTFKRGWTGLFAHWSRSEVKYLAGLSLVTTGAALAGLCAGPQLPLCLAAAAGIFYSLQHMTDRGVDQLYDNGYRLTTRLLPYTKTYWERR